MPLPKEIIYTVIDTYLQEMKIKKTIERQNSMIDFANWIIENKEYTKEKFKKIRSVLSVRF